ncbi:MAG: helix-turn-helix domain-containing protein [Ruminococcaceae bacterium]|nr:helix-turn-helix domain-containing protein [Oscillospiraceae bacterium]
MTLSNKIIYCRKRAGLSQEELSEVIGVSRQAISKWETGEATPEVGKLLLLSKTFGVTTDWLLSEDEPVEEPSAEEQAKPHENPYYHKTAEERSYPDWVDNLPKTLGRLLKRFGWLAGVYIALVGAGITFIGGILKLVTSFMFTGFSSTTDVMVSEMNGMVFGGGYDPFFDQYNTAAGEMFDNFAKSNPVSILSTVMLVSGVILIIGGIVLAVMLKKYGREK